MFAECPNCGGEVQNRLRSYQCSCGLTVWKKIAGRRIDEKTAGALLADGRVGPLEGFKSRKGKPFTATLVLKETRVELEFHPKNLAMEPPEQKREVLEEPVPIRIQASNSGSVTIHIGNPLHFECEVSFGLVPARFAETLGAIAAVNLVRHNIKDGLTKAGVVLSFSSQDTVRYILREKRSRDNDTQQAVHYLWERLQGIPWSAEWKREKRPRLEGSPKALEFPAGIFPWLRAEVAEKDGRLLVSLPDDAAVRAQFKASFWRTALPAENGFSVSLRSERAVLAWLAVVKHGTEKKFSQMHMDNR